MAVYESAQPSDIASRLDRSLDRSPDSIGARSGAFLATLAHIFAQDRRYHTVMATLTASENYASLLVRAAAAFLGGEHYFFDPPTGGQSGEWTFPASGALLGLQKKFLQQMRLMFGADIADWRPNGGSVCEQAVLMAACRRGDAFVEIGGNDGGHFGAGGLAEELGAQRFTFPMREDLIDIRCTARLAEENPHIRLVLVQPSHCRRQQPIEQLAAALPRRVTIAVDVSHTAGLIAGGVIPSPLTQGAHLITFNTHKTLPGPNKGVIAFGDRDHPLAEKVWQLVCPTLQSNSHPECLPGLVLALEEAATYGRAYAEQTIANARTLARVLHRKGARVAGMEYGGTQNHQVHLVIGSAQRANGIANQRLPMCGIRTNSVVIPGTHGKLGLRLGTQALTRRGLTESEFNDLGCLLAEAVSGGTDARHIRSAVAELLAEHPLFPLRFSFDELNGSREVRRLLAEVLR
jgi:glycine hydroxymethyltransferase